MFAKHLSSAMVEKDPLIVAQHVEEFSLAGEMEIGIAGNNGQPAFNTYITAPEKILAAHEETSIRSNGELILFKPLKNELRCHGCHSPGDKTRGMIIVKTSLRKAHAQLNETAKRLIGFSILIGLISELFLIIFLRKMILRPIEALTEGANLLRNGNLDHRIVLKRDDEIGDLASCFNEMADSIEQSHISMESAVRQKTKELRAIAELSSDAFRGDRDLKEIADQFLDAIISHLGYRYSALCLIDKETGLLLQEFKKGVDNNICDIEISVASEHPFIKTIREAKPAIKNSQEINAPDTFGNVVIIPIVSHQRKRCREVNNCAYETCP
ncbi:MAG: HAMP domain-containing protein, partial [Nitrospirae bacterium]